MALNIRQKQCGEYVAEAVDRSRPSVEDGRGLAGRERERTSTLRARASIDTQRIDTQRTRRIANKTPAHLTSIVIIIIIIIALHHHA